MEAKETEGLEPQQYQQLYREDDVPLKDVRKNVLRKFVYIGVALCLLFITIGLFVTFPDEVELPFVIKSSGSEQIYRFPNPVYVIDKYIKPHDSVVKGQPLVRITSPEIVVLINNYHEAEQNFENFSSQKVLSIEKQKMIITNKIRENENNIGETQKQLSVLNNIWKSNLAEAEFENDAALKRYEVMKKLFDEKATSKFELDDFETKKNKAADALESAKQNYEKVKFNLRTLNNKYLLANNSETEELHKINFDSKYDSASIYNQYVLAKNKIENTFGNFELSGGDLILKANENGIVSYIFDGEKEVSAGSILLKLIHDTAGLYAWVKSPPSKIGRLAINKSVVLKVASFPVYEWGAMKGHIENLSLTPDEAGNFSVKISIDSFGKLKDLMQIGMNGDATIIVEERTFYYYFFRNVKKVYYNATKPHSK
ncbi:MAG: hypothetical protein ABI863_17825 [Ginsengibacter sp.]